MALRTGKFLPVGMRFAAVFALDAAGRPKATDILAYTGLRWEAPLAFDMTFPQARSIAHMGRDSIVGTATLPSQEVATGTLRVSDFRFDIHSLLTGMAIGTVGEAREIAHLTDLEGYEAVVGLLLYQQAQDLDSGAMTWHSYVIPKARCIPVGGSMNNNAGEVSYQIIPRRVTQRLWGKTLVRATDKYTRAGIFEYDSEGEPGIVSFLANGSATTFAFPSGEEAKSTAKIEAYRQGVKVASGLTPASTGLTFAVAPTDEDNITVWYERAGADAGESV